MRGARPASIWTLALLGALCFAASCGTPTFVVQQYAGAPRAAEAIAIIRVEGGGKVQLLSLDGEATDARVASDARLHIEILPGNHRLWVQGFAADGAAQSLTFRAEAGKMYRVDLALDPATNAFSPHVYEVDPSSNAPKVDVTSTQAPPAEVQARTPQAPRKPTPPAPVIVEQSAVSQPPADAGAPGDAGTAADSAAPAP